MASVSHQGHSESEKENLGLRPTSSPSTISGERVLVVSGIMLNLARFYPNPPLSLEGVNTADLSAGTGVCHSAGAAWVVDYLRDTISI